MDDTYLKALLLRALKSPHGIGVQTLNPHSLRSRLYAIAREQDVTHLLLLTIGPDNPNELWIIQRSELRNGKIREPQR